LVGDYGLAEVYATDSFTNPTSNQSTSTGWQHVPTYVTIPGQGVSGYEQDALPTLPTASDGVYTWAPTVRYIDGHYLMMFSEGISGRANCIGAAISSTGFTFTPINSWTFCSGTANVGFLDPYLFSDPSTGDTWLLYSRQWWDGAAGTTPESEIDSVQIDPAGIESGADNCPFPVADCGLLSTNYQMITFQDVVGLIKPGTDDFTPGAAGTNDRIENPAIVADPYNGYDLTFALGSWYLPNYQSGEDACLLAYGDCIANNSLEITCQQGCGGDQYSNQMYNSPGGFSFLYDASPTNNYTIWHSFRDPGTCPPNGLNPLCAVRDDWSGPTAADNLNSLYDGDGTYGTSPRPLVAKGSRKEATYYPLRSATEPKDATPHDWIPRVYNAHYPDVMIGPLPASSPLAQSESRIPVSN
jgi:hypothetical protein